ncbi:cytochrome P450 [Achromobacter sp. UMC71]|uniref:cytochrome P450 n=1 Tax=Achromobacter sp. UMC71 TaxID=1862320 RepID=UPI00160148C4|nr:cytochrome P450 [Achromobacter sp. UMC71]MBB1629046.1 cytochrome [Achromobacter sp. UMC71]
MPIPDPLDPLQAVTHPDPYPYYAALARDRPLYHDARLGLWVASSPGAILEVMRHPAARVRPMAEPVPKGIAAGPAGALFGSFARMTDGAAHACSKRLLANFVARQAQHACSPAWPDPQTKSRADTTTDTGPDAVDVDHYLYAAPVHAQAAFLGLPAAVLAGCARDIRDFLAALPPAAAAPVIATGHAAASRLSARLHAHLQAPQASPALRELRLEGARAGLDPALLAANLVGLLFQSCEAGAGLLGNALVLSGRRGASSALTREQAQTLVDTALRDDPAIHNTRRFLAEPIDAGGQHIEAGATVLLVLAAAATVQPQAHWPFGALAHACPGRDLARQHAAGALRHLLQAGTDAAALAARFRYRALPNARIPQFAIPKDATP